MATPRIIAKDVAPWATALAKTIPYLRNPDPTLTAMTGRDESLFTDMRRTMSAIESAMSTRRDTLMSPGWKLVPGDGPNSKRIHDWTEAAIEGIDDFYTSLSMAHEGVGAGWIPIEKIWEPWTHDGEAFWRIKYLREKPQENFAFSPDRNLVQLPRMVDGNTSHFIWKTGDRPTFAHQMKWLVVRFGSTNNPYGDALLSKAWPLWYIHGKFLQMWTGGMQASTGGQLKVKDQRPHTSADTGKIDHGSVAQMHADVQLMADTYRSDSILLAPPGIDVEVMERLAASKTWQEAIEYFNKEVSKVIMHQHLANSQEGTGSLAASKTQRLSLRDVACGDGHVIGEAINRQVLGHLYRFNFGEVANEDKSRFEFNICHQVNEERLAMLPADLPDWAKLAADGNIPVLTPEERDAKRQVRMAERKAFAVPSGDEDDEDAADAEDEDEDDETGDS